MILKHITHGGGNLYICCADYVAMVLHYADLVDLKEINKVNYHHVDGITQLLTSQGWEKLTYEEAEPGDIGVSPSHTFVLWENDTIWDEAIGQYSVLHEISPIRAGGPYNFSEQYEATYYRCP